ncbi:MAG: rRNA maturation RNase YbeY [Acidobacteriota bacterium]
MTRAAAPRDRLCVTVTSDRPTRATAGLAAFLTSTAPVRARGTVEIALVSDRRMRALNRSFRGVDRPTDVLSFPHGEERIERLKSNTQSHLGDIAIAVGIARRQAAERRHTLTVELRILALHGLLHLLGYDHERDRGEMRRLEERLRRRAGLNEGLIARTRA